MCYKIVKRMLDLLISGLAILLLSPLLLVIALAIRLDSPGPVFFIQDRIGLHKKRFRIYKFRTMRSDTPADVPTHLLQDPHASITATGRLLRRTSLDELPQLFNIFKGQMSIIGPRPALWNQYDLEAERDRYGANDVLPGLTGWAQINGRDELPIAVKASLDGEYVRKMSLAFDMKCFFKTFRSVLKSEGVAEGGVKDGIKDGVKDGVKSGVKDDFNGSIKGKEKK